MLHADMTDRERSFADSTTTKTDNILDELISCSAEDQKLALFGFTSSMPLNSVQKVSRFYPKIVRIQN